MNVLRKEVPGFFKLNENAYRYRFRRGKRIRDPKRVERVRETGIGGRKGASWHPFERRKSVSDRFGAEG